MTSRNRTKDFDHDANQAKPRRITRRVVVASIWLTAGLLAVGALAAYRMATVFPPSQVDVIGVQTTATERIVYLQEDANTMYWIESIGTMGSPNPWVKLHMRLYSMRAFAPTVPQERDRFPVPLDCERFTLVGPLGEMYAYKIADLPEIAAEDAPPSVHEIYLQSPEYWAAETEAEPPVMKEN